MTIRGFIFDLDGTLIDSLKDITNALNHALAYYELPLATPRQARDWIGDGLPTLMRRAAPTADDQTLDSLIRLAKSYYADHPVRETVIYPNILKTLDLLQFRNVPICVLSNKPHALTARIVEVMDLAKYFTMVRGCQMDEERKPSPDVALQMARHMDVSPSAIALVGDSPVDVTTARNAGMVAVAVAWGFREIGELAEMEPDFLLEAPEKLPSLVDRLTAER